uniref:Uncharacterized protein n=1 Tax=Clandestinovirus TaxID=2831644 RepID=A0A8F8PKC3_9VIRU|nr:hypothetical protein KOM_12_353 [Clandestinovirus]
MATEEQEVVDKVLRILDVADENLHPKYEVYKAKEAFHRLLAIKQQPDISVKESDDAIKANQIIEEQLGRIAQLESQMVKLQQENKCLSTTLRAMESWTSVLINQSKKPKCKKIK